MSFWLLARFFFVALSMPLSLKEILMDYGDEWSHAWDEHVASWIPPSDASEYVHSTKYNILHLKTPSERISDPYPPNLHTLCSASFRKVGERYVYLSVLREMDERFYCNVTHRTGDLYTVEMELEDGRVVIVENVSRPQGVDLYDKVYSQDWHQHQAFRHKIGIPDDIFPEAWKNLKGKA